MPNIEKPKAPDTPAQAKRKAEQQRKRRAELKAKKERERLRAERSKTLTGKLLNFIDDVLSK
jgi:hypothetical protein